MSANGSREEDLTSRLFGAKEAADAALDALAIHFGDKAVAEFEALREQLLDKFKNSGIVPEREMDHAAVVGPALEVINTIFDGAIRRLKE